MNYAKDIDKLTEFTTTYRPPTKTELEDDIIEDAIRLSKKSWYESKKYLVDRIKLNARRLWMLNESE